MRFATRAIHTGQAPDASTGATIPPIHISSTFTQAGPGAHKGFEYARSDNPTRRNLEQCLAALEGGAAAAAFASGLAATNAIVAGLLRPGDVVLAYGDLYGGTFRLFERVFKPWGLVTRYSDSNDAAALAALVDARTRLVWIETPTNPMLRLIDIAAVCRALEGRGAERPIVVVDNTFATPALQRPLELGADLVVHSTTKYLGGHSDVVGGAVIAADAARLEPVRFVQNALGGVPGPFDCYLVQRGIKTLAVRMQLHCANAARVAQWAAEQREFEWVIYPGLAIHPEHALAGQQMAGPGGMVSVVLRDGLAGVRRFLARLRVFACAESLGGVESLANHPTTMTHASVPKGVRERMGLVEGLVRLSVGLEEAQDLIDDLAQAL